MYPLICTHNATMDVLQQWKSDLINVCPNIRSRRVLRKLLVVGRLNPNWRSSRDGTSLGPRSTHYVHMIRSGSFTKYITYMHIYIYGIHYHNTIYMIYICIYGMHIWCTYIHTLLQYTCMCFAVISRHVLWLLHFKN